MILSHKEFPSKPSPSFVTTSNDLNIQITCRFQIVESFNRKVISGQKFNERHLKSRLKWMTKPEQWFQHLLTSPDYWELKMSEFNLYLSCAIALFLVSLCFAVEFMNDNSWNSVARQCFPMFFLISRGETFIHFHITQTASMLFCAQQFSLHSRVKCVSRFIWKHLEIKFVLNIFLQLSECLLLFVKWIIWLATRLQSFLSIRHSFRNKDWNKIYYSKCFCFCLENR